MYLSWYYIDRLNTLMEEMGHGVCVLRINNFEPCMYQAVALCKERSNNAVYTSEFCSSIDGCVRQLIAKFENHKANIPALSQTYPDM